MQVVPSNENAPILISIRPMPTDIRETFVTLPARRAVAPHPCHLTLLRALHAPVVVARSSSFIIAALLVPPSRRHIRTILAPPDWGRSMPLWASLQFQGGESCLHSKTVQNTHNSRPGRWPSQQSSDEPRLSSRSISCTSLTLSRRVVTHRISPPCLVTKVHGTLVLLMRRRRWCVRLLARLLLVGRCGDRLLRYRRVGLLILRRLHWRDVVLLLGNKALGSGRCHRVGSRTGGNGEVLEFRLGRHLRGVIPSLLLWRVLRGRIALHRCRPVRRMLLRRSMCRSNLSLRLILWVMLLLSDCVLVLGCCRWPL